MALDRNTFITEVPQMASEDTSYVGTMLLVAGHMVTRNQYKNNGAYESAVFLMTAHLIQLEKVARHGAAGATITRSKTAVTNDGNSSTETVNFAGGIGSAKKNVTDDDLRQSVYGRSFILLRNSMLGSGLAITYSGDYNG